MKVGWIHSLTTVKLYFLLPNLKPLFLSYVCLLGSVFKHLTFQHLISGRVLFYIWFFSAMYVCVCVCVYIYIYIYIYTHTYRERLETTPISVTLSKIKNTILWGASLYSHNCFSYPLLEFVTYYSAPCGSLQRLMWLGISTSWDWYLPFSFHCSATHWMITFSK